MADYLPAGIEDFSVWLNNFATQIGIHGATVGATPAEMWCKQRNMEYVIATI